MNNDEFGVRILDVAHRALPALRLPSAVNDTVPGLGTAPAQVDRTLAIGLASFRLAQLLAPL